jgi:hypothetical protein
MKGKAFLYKKGDFIEIEDVINWDLDWEFEEQLRKEGYRPGLTVGNPEFPHMRVWQLDYFNNDAEVVYPYFASVEIGDITCNHLYFENCWELLHFLENYSGWALNLDKIERIYRDYEKLYENEN